MRPDGFDRRYINLINCYYNIAVLWLIVNNIEDHSLMKDSISRIMLFWMSLDCEHVYSNFLKLRRFTYISFSRSSKFLKIVIQERTQNLFIILWNVNIIKPSGTVGIQYNATLSWIHNNQLSIYLLKIIKLFSLNFN